MAGEEGEGGACPPGSAEPGAASCGKKQLDTHTSTRSPLPGLCQAGLLEGRGRVWIRAAAGEGSVAAFEAGGRGGKGKGKPEERSASPRAPGLLQEAPGTQATPP